MLFCSCCLVGSPYSLRSNQIPSNAYKSWLLDWLLTDSPKSTLNYPTSHLVLFLLYEIWYIQNCLVFQKSNIHPNSTILQAKTKVELYARALSNFSSLSIFSLSSVTRQQRSILIPNTGFIFNTPGSTIFLNLFESCFMFYYVSVFMQDCFIKIIQVYPTSDSCFKLINEIQILRNILLQVAHTMQNKLNILTNSKGLTLAIKVSTSSPISIQCYPSRLPPSPLSN